MINVVAAYLERVAVVEPSICAVSRWLSGFGGFGFQF